MNEIERAAMKADVENDSRFRECPRATLQQLDSLKAVLQGTRDLAVMERLAEVMGLNEKTNSAFRILQGLDDACRVLGYEVRRIE